MRRGFRPASSGEVALGDLLKGRPIAEPRHSDRQIERRSAAPETLPIAEDEATVFAQPPIHRVWIAGNPAGRLKERLADHLKAMEERSEPCAFGYCEVCQRLARQPSGPLRVKQRQRYGRKHTAM